MSTEPAASAAKEDSNKISMTLPSAVMASLKGEGDQIDMSPGEWVKHHLIAAYTQPGGIHINLQAIAKAADPRQPELPLATA